MIFICNFAAQTIHTLCAAKHLTFCVMKKSVIVALLVLSVTAFAATSQQLENRAHELISQMTLEEKFHQLMNSTPGIERLGIKPYDYWNEALHGVARTGRATAFPEPIGLGATFDPELVQALGDVVATEGRAKYELAQKQDNYSRYTGLTYWSPNVNIFRDPRWGRGMETYGEDPYLSGTLGSAYVRGIQGNDPVYLKAAACGKHFAVHSGPEATRHEADIYPTTRDLYETYTPAFKMLIDNNVEAVMMAYNSVYGTPCSANTLLFDILRNRFGFKGHIVSDCGAVDDIYKGHATAKTAAEASALAIKAGLNIECGSTFLALNQALEQGLVTEADIDAALFPLILTRLKLGILDADSACPYNHVGEEVIGCEKHISLARQAARESMVLLKNDNNLLPLSKHLDNLEVSGSGATDVYSLMGNYYGISSRYSCYLQGIASAVSAGTTVDFRPGCMAMSPTVNPTNWAVYDAQGAKYTILILGLNGNNEGENGDAIASTEEGDRNNLSIPAPQLNYLRQIREVKKEGLILVLTGGGPLDMSELYDLADAIIMTWYAGQEGGLALGDLIFGDCNFSGRLPVTFPADVNKLPDFNDYHMQGRSYKYMTDNVFFPFGYGLSYCHVTYADAQALNLRKGRLVTTEPLRTSVKITNTGNREVTEVVQAYLSVPGAGVAEAKAESRKTSKNKASTPNLEDVLPLQTLVGFQRISLVPGETREVEFSIPVEQLKTITTDGSAALLKGTYTLSFASAAPVPQSQAANSTLPKLNIESAALNFVVK